MMFGSCYAAFFSLWVAGLICYAAAYVDRSFVIKGFGASRSLEGTRRFATRLNMKAVSEYGKTLNGVVRGHRCLFDDRCVTSSNMALLLRGADSAQRLLYPLEVETNKHDVEYTDFVLAMYERSDEALKFAQDGVFENFRELNPNDKGTGQMIAEDLKWFHRLLQYAIAAGVPQFMRPEMLQFLSDLYHESEMNFDALNLGCKKLKEYYKKVIPEDGWSPSLERSFDVLTSTIDKLRKQPAYALDKRSSKPMEMEADPEPGSVSPLLVDEYSKKDMILTRT